MDADSQAVPEPSWFLYRGTGTPMNPADRDRRWPAPPPWRTFSGAPDSATAPPPPQDGTAARVLGPPGVPWPAVPDEVVRVNIALRLRRPLLVSGGPDTGRSAVAHRIARELGLGPVLRWRVTGGSTLTDALYGPAGGGTFRLGPLGTALLPRRLPRVLLVDGLDRGGFDLPEQVLGTLEDGEFVLPELLGRTEKDPGTAVVHTWETGRTATLRDALVRCHEPPLVVITSGGEADLSPGCVRQCVPLTLPPMTAGQLTALARARFPALAEGRHGRLLEALVERLLRDPDTDAPGLLLDVLHLVDEGALDETGEEDEVEAALDTVWRWAVVEGP
ncbi:AAA ATPase [Streptomyces lincolnensis]|uniref:AAA ATPase n=1 Tax=Streptomyces lincolnensis TaxID=1915 RepID=A0A1B1M4Y0_STRLN|nr:ATP-binding protein [Streptomyces lincolnensis]ANS63695.1 AAA ATPase [Streptomyces lincolnensis]AXG52617.1 ATPase [Streptomyces lincolnensis]QMV05558.1 ATP-binding protein [Streptomyces lincolnensis]